nr:MAG TPA: hypothetical protein [Caudoviricetes sp.]
MIGCEIVLIIGVDKMAAEIEAAANYILGVPAEFIPVTMVIAMVIGLVCTFAVSLPGFYQQDKEIARKNGGKITYGISYLSSNILIVAICVVASLAMIGWYADASGVQVTAGLCNSMALVVSAIIGLGGSKFLALPFVESIRDKAKADVARAKMPEQ